MTDLPSRAPAEGQRRRVPGREPMTDLGPIVTLADPARPGARLRLTSQDESGPVPPVAVDHMDAAYAASSPAIPSGTGRSSTC